MKQVELMLLLQDQLDAEEKTLYHVRQIEDEVRYRKTTGVLQEFEHWR